MTHLDVVFVVGHAWVCCFSTGSLAQKMLITSGKKRPSLDGPSSSHASPAVTEKPAAVTEKPPAPNNEEHLSAVLRGSFKQGHPKESEWHGSAEEMAEKHVAFLKTWFIVAKGGNTPIWRKLWQKSFPHLTLDNVNTILQKIGGIKNFAKKKAKNSVTGEKMPIWLKEIVAALDLELPQPKLPVAGLERPDVKSKPALVAGLKRPDHQNQEEPQLRRRLTFKQESPPRSFNHCPPAHKSWQKTLSNLHMSV